MQLLKHPPSSAELHSAWSNLKTLGSSGGGQLHQLLDVFQGVWEEDVVVAA